MKDLAAWQQIPEGAAIIPISQVSSVTGKSGEISRSQKKRTAKKRKKEKAEQRSLLFSLLKENKD